MARWIGLSFIVLAFGFLLSTANGQDVQKKKLDAMVIFKKLDTNSDGKLTKEEFLKLADNFKNRDKAREKLTASYDRYDTSKMGMSLDHFRTYLDSVKKKSETRTTQP